MKRCSFLLLVMVLTMAPFNTASTAAARGRILHVDSYHEEFPWSMSITNGITSVLAERKDVELKIFRMDTKRNRAEDYKKAVALKAKELIETWKPDVVIASDDNASKYLVAPYYKGKELPFVFCGLNWDAGAYGFPAENITGMVEVALIPDMLETLKRYARGERIGFIGYESTTARKEARAYGKRFKLEMTERYAKSFKEWKKYYRSLQEEVDLLLMHNAAGMNDWNQEEAEALVLRSAIIPSGSISLLSRRLALVSYIKIGEEQGEYAARAALKILEGESPGEMPIVRNKKAKIYLNMKLAKKMGLKFPMELIERAHLISAE